MVEENNKLIHRFLNKGPLIPDYSKHWNLLMEVLEHLTKMGVVVILSNKHCILESESDSYISLEDSGNNLKEMVYDSIVKFIKYVNGRNGK